MLLPDFLSIIHTYFFFFFNCYLAAPQPTLGHSRGDSLTNPILITAFFVHIRPKGHREPRNEVRSLSPAKRLVGFELGTFRFILQRLTPLGHFHHPIFIFKTTNCNNIFLLPKPLFGNSKQLAAIPTQINLLHCLLSFLIHGHI